MAKIKFPYVVKCPSCKAGIKVKSKEMIGKRIPCPKCEKKMDIYSPDEEGSIPYDITAPPPEKKKEAPTEEELELKEKERRKARNTVIKKRSFYVIEILLTLAFLVMVGFFLYRAVDGFWEDWEKEEQKHGAKKKK